MTNKYDGKLEQARMAIAEEWTRTIMRPILATGMVTNLIALAGMDDGTDNDRDMDWIFDVISTCTGCERCEEEGTIDCPDCDGEGVENDSAPGNEGEIENSDCARCDGGGRIDCDADDCDHGRVERGEIFEYWIVEERAERRLREAGETMIDADDIGLGNAIWCRRTTGQGIAGDGVVIRCAELFALNCPWLLSDVNPDHVKYWRENRYTDVPAEHIDTMLAHYIEAALWCSTDNSRDDGGDPLDKNYGADDIDADALARMRFDVARFAHENREQIEAYGGTHGTWEAAGHDFWLTRTGSGVGFWDRDNGVWPHDGKKLTDASKEFGECGLYVGDDKKLYL